MPLKSRAVDWRLSNKLKAADSALINAILTATYGSHGRREQTKTKENLMLEVDAESE